ncbi:MAG: hypothetical protein ACI38U_00285 [Corynebacterium sp.]|uniref:hypothetical protein n=1 Tax=Corynebacterium sp. TaxID=1720 RepID=UPI003F06BA52
MEVGTLADWASAAGGLLGVFAAFSAWRTARNQLDIEYARNAEEQKQAVATAEAKRREQAELCYSMYAILPERENGNCYAIFISNDSNKPIYDVTIKSRKFNGSANPDLNLGAVPPGRFIVASDPKLNWGKLEDRSDLSERVDLIAKGKGNKLIESMEFADAARNRWTVSNASTLKEQVGKQTTPDA